MRLIDADRLLKTTQTYDLIRALEQAKEVKAIPLDKVKQAREEIEQLKPNNHNFEHYKGETRVVNQALAILDKLIAESEEADER